MEPLKAQIQQFMSDELIQMEQEVIQYYLTALAEKFSASPTKPACARANKPRKLG